MLNAAGRMSIAWNYDFNLVTDEGSWNRKFKVCHHTIPDNVLIWFQLRIVYRFLGTMYYVKEVASKLPKMLPISAHVCRLFSYEQIFWNNLTKHVSDKVTYNVKFKR